MAQFPIYTVGTYRIYSRGDSLETILEIVKVPQNVGTFSILGTENQGKNQGTKQQELGRFISFFGDNFYQNEVQTLLVV